MQGGGDSLRADIERINDMAECKACGHRDTQHAKFGCNQGFCKCELSNQDVIDFEKLAALRKAGEKMAKQLKDLRGFQEEAEMRGQSSIIVETEYIFNTEDAAALAEWEAANK
jgi:hypothetical protein